MTPGKTSAIVTAAVAVAIILLLMLAHLTFRPEEQRPSRQPVAAMEEFVEVYNPVAAQAPAPAQNVSAPAPAANVQPTAPAAAVPAPAPTPAPAAPAAPAGSSEAELDIAAAFSDGPSDTPGGAPQSDGQAGAGAGSGAGSGTVGGGWIMPHYASLPSTKIGSVRLRATVDASGTAMDVVQIGGQSPAAADRALVERCIAEVRSRKFTRADDNAPPSATAYITYVFR